MTCMHVDALVLIDLNAAKRPSHTYSHAHTYTTGTARIAFASKRSVRRRHPRRRRRQAPLRDGANLMRIITVALLAVRIIYIT